MVPRTPEIGSVPMYDGQMLEAVRQIGSLLTSPFSQGRTARTLQYGYTTPSVYL